MKRLILATGLALAACTSEPAPDPAANDANAALPMEPAATVPTVPGNAAEPGANTIEGNAAPEPPARSQPDRGRPYQPLPPETPPPPEPEPEDPHAGHDMANMAHPPEH